MTQKRLAAKMDPSSQQQQGVPSTTPKHHRAAPGTIALPPNSVFTFPSNDYFSPGAPFLAAGAPLTPHPHGGGMHTPAVAGARLARTPHPTTPHGYGLEPETPTISVRIAGSDVIQDVILSPMVERPPAWMHHDGSSYPRENSQTRTSDEESLYGAHAFPLRPPPHLIRSRRTSRITSHPPSVHQDHYHASSSPMDRRRSSLNQQQQQQQQEKEHEVKPQTSTSKSSGTSAVSPRFMALRKLSESGMVCIHANPVFMCVGRESFVWTMYSPSIP